MEIARAFVGSKVSNFHGSSALKRELDLSPQPGKIIQDNLSMNLDATSLISYSNRNFVSAKIYSSFNGLRSADYTVQYSDDNTNWTTAFSGVASNNSSCGISKNTGSGNGSYGARRYWRYVEGSAIVSHHPRVSRIVLTDIYGIDVDIIVYTNDNCSDSGTYIIGTVNFDSALSWYDISGNSLNARGSSVISNQKLLQNQPYNTATTNILNTDRHSLFFSIQINGTSGAWSKLFAYQANGSDRSPGIWRWPASARFHWRYDDGNSGADFDVTSVNGYNEPSGTQFQPNVWYYVGVTKNLGTATCYVNGNKIGTSSVTNPKRPGQAPINIFPDYSSTAAIKHIHIYGKVLSDSEVLHNYNAISSSLV